MSIRITSPAFIPGGRIPMRFTRDGDNVSPPLSWSGLPPDSKELVVIVDDPDAPSPQPFVHWVAYKIPASTPGLTEHMSRDTAPRHSDVGAQGTNSFARIGYDGPAPPRGHGVHRYRFQVYALDQPLAVQGKLDKQSLMTAMAGHVLDEGELVGTYER